jgi:hypothetical protein
MPDGANLATLGPLGLDGQNLRERAQQAFYRPNWEQTWESLRRLFLPISQPFMVYNITQGQRDRETTVDTYGRYCARVHAAFLYGGIVNGSGDWFKVVVSDHRGEDVDVPEIVAVSDRTQGELANVLMSEETGFTEQYFAMLMERTVYGNGILYGGDRPGNLPIVHAAPLRDCAWEGGRLNHTPENFWWRQKLTAGEWEKKLPGRMLGVHITEALKTNAGRNRDFTLTHGMIENPSWTPAVIDQAPQLRRFLSVWLSEDESRVLSNNFLTSNPYTAFRCYRRSNENYGRGPSDEALEEAAMAQRVRIAVIRGMEKSIDPTMLLPDDGVSSPPTNEPDGAIVVRAELMRQAGDPIRFLRPQGNPQLGMEFLRDGVYQAMDRAYSRDIMSLPREPRMVESQIIGLQEEQSRGVVPLLAPLFAPTARFIARVYDMRRRQGRMPQWPVHMMAGHSVSIEFRNPLEKAARLAEVRAFMQSLNIMLECMKIDPSARFALKVVEGSQWCFRVLGVPERFIPTKKEIDASLAAAAQQQQQQQGMETALDASTVMKNAGAGLGAMPQAQPQAAANAP